MNKEDCAIGQRVKIKQPNTHDILAQNRRFEGLIGTIKELPLGYVVVEIALPFLARDIEPVEVDEKAESK